MKKTVVKQNDKFSCAVACVLSIIRYYGGNIAYEEVAMITNTSKFGTNALDIIEGVRTIGFDGRGIKCTLDELVSMNKTNPLIAHTVLDGMYHFVVIYGVDTKRKRIKVMDPSKGLVSMKFEVFKNLYLNTVIELVPVDEIPNIKSEVNYYRYFYQFFIKNRIEVFKIFFYSLLLLLVSIIYSFLLKYIYYRSEVIILFITIIIFKNLFSLFKDFIVIDIENKMGINMMNYTFSHLFKINTRYIKNKSTGDVASRIREVEDFKNRVLVMVLNLFVNILFIIITLVVLGVINIKLTLVSIIFMVAFILLNAVYIHFIKKHIEGTKNTLGIYEGYINEVIVNYASIKNMNVEGSILLSLMNKYYKFANSFKILEKKFVKLSTFKTLISDIFVISIIVYSLLFIKSNDILFIYTIVLSFVEPLGEVVNYIFEVSDLKVVFRRINDLLVVREEQNITNKKINGDISIKNVSFGYKTSIFKSVSFDIKQGSMFLIYGRSGSGKSTLLKILTKDLIKYKGDIFINDFNLKDIDKSVIDNSITNVTQEEHLFNDTLENNIKFYREVSDEEYERILKITKVDLIRNSKEFRNDYLIYEDGVNLSGGERQKIILARALLKDSNYLILDEALSEVNFKDEIEIVESIRENFKDKTLIYVSHKKEIIDYFKDKHYMKGGEAY